MKITKSDLENYRFDKQQAEIYNDAEEMKRLANIVAYIRETTHGATTAVIMARYIIGDGLGDNGKRETWEALGKRLGYSKDHVKGVHRLFLKQIEESHS